MNTQHTPGEGVTGPVFDSTGRLMAAVATTPARCPSGARCEGYEAEGGLRFCCYCGQSLKPRTAIAKATGSAS
jgi:hypothetical protein